MDKSIKKISDLYIKTIEKNQPHIIDQLIEMDQQAFGEGGLDEWTMVPILRHGRIVALYHGKQIIGGAQFLRDWDDMHKAYLYGVSIAKEHRGKKFGTYFLKLCFNQLKEENFDTIELTVDPDNHRAIRVYQKKLGFKIMDERKNEYGKGEDRIIMQVKI